MAVPHLRHQIDLTDDQVDHALGALLGSACGDALGAPFEFGPPNQYSQRFPRAVLDGTGEMIGGGSFGWEPGEFTDDTQMAIALGESLVENRRVNPEDLWARWRAWVAEARDVGSTTRSSLHHADWREAAESAHMSLGQSAGNGALMRVTPVALACARLAPGLATRITMQAAVDQGALTHHDPAAAWGAAIGAEGTRRIIIGGASYDDVDEALDYVPEGVGSFFATLISPRWEPGADSVPGNGSVWGCLAQAAWAVRTTKSFEDAMATAIDLGGDTDTVACVAGAFAGATYGLEAIPARWLAAVHGRLATPVGVVEYRSADLLHLGRRLLGLDTG